MIWENPFKNEKIPSISDLWQNEKKLYRVWIFTYPVLLVLMGILLFVQLFLNFDLRSWGRTISILSIILIILTLFYYVISIFSSYRMKDFASIGNQSFVTVFFAHVLSSISILNSTILMVWHLTPQSDSFIGILITQILLIPLNFFVIPYFYKKVIKIKSIFKLSHSLQVFEKQMEQMKKDPQTYSKVMDIFSFAESKNSNFAKTNQDTEKQNPQSVENSDSQNNEINLRQSKEEEIRLRLQKLEAPVLQKLAQKLEISGYTELKKEELINLLVRILSQQEK
ncbi:hypothetical protein [Mycoplasma sp. 'Moose RK']|uniref:hypothetical protein n=1 Tax=Mycoplasma sp. 'Moose RK' TaxID=2780095 RepID=UPI0018C2EF3D|nr:hypothetical protein [Mycoplasma sp. 'Moose RK']MBG0730688.1 hypothetical protein [Mycoplasma sp. 'Moose RK']